MIFGSAASLPENLFSEDLSIRSSANEQNNGFGEASNNISDYWDDWYHEKYYDEDQLQDEKVGGDGSDEYKITKYTLLTCTATWLPHNYGYKVWVGDDDRGSYNYESHTAVCIGKRAFSISNLAEIDIQEGYTEIEDEAFYNCYSLKKIVIPKSVTKIGEKAIGFTDDGIKENLTICCYKDSAAEKYAKDNNVNYELIPEEYKMHGLRNKRNKNSPRNRSRLGRA